MTSTSPAARGFNAGMAWLAALALALAPQEEVADEELDALLAAFEQLGAEAMLDILAGQAGWTAAFQAALRDPETPAADRAAIRRALETMGVADEPRASVVAEPSPQESVPRKKTLRSTRLDDTMAAALLLGGATITLTGLLLWTLRRKD
jgi:hypothetical protein